LSASDARPAASPGRLFLLAFVGTHLPLLVLLVYTLTARDRLNGGLVLLIALAATLAGTGLVFWILRYLLSPALKAARVLAGDGRAADLGTLAEDAGAAVRERDEAREALAAQSRRDPLTGLLNRQAATERITAEAAAGAPLSVVLLDVVGFGALNDERGPAAGDAALRALGEYLEAMVPRDSLLAPAWAARWGGDEFLVALRADAAAADAFVSRLLLTLPAAPPAGGAPSVPLACRAGVATYEPGDTAGSLLRRAAASVQNPAPSPIALAAA
jgi:diguanylate cyclase (GGDEF)-like protein